MFEVSEDIMNNITVDGGWYPNYEQTINKSQKKKKKEIERHIWLNIPRGSDDLLVPLLT